jgi:hypothetical protein
MKPVPFRRENPEAAYLRVAQAMPGSRETQGTLQARLRPTDRNAAAPEGEATAKASPAATSSLADARERAFLRLLRWSEIGDVPDDTAYRARFGSKDPMTDADMQHYTPKQEPYLQPKGLRGRAAKRAISTAAGAYQITQITWDDYKKQLHLLDFLPQSQDTIAKAIIRHYHADGEIRAGRMHEAYARLRGRWPSLPGGSQSHHPERETTAKFERYLAEEVAKK